MYFCTQIAFTMKYISILSISLIIFFSCSNQESKQKKDVTQTQQKIQVAVPDFNADSAFHFVAQQLSFGPRIPESEAHAQCANWLANKLNSFADTVIIQDFRTRLYNGKGVDGKNIIATFNPNAKKRIVLSAHWDSRPFADHDPNESNHNKAIDGANDGASGVGILMELARLFKSHPLNEKLGVDIVLFDLEDYGPPESQRENYDENGWALGSQYWSKSPHILGYQASFGILLDMVGASNPHFSQEYFSQQLASWISNKVWHKAHELGYGDYFPLKLGNPITDDHIPMNTIAKIPTIDIIHLEPDSENGSFFEHWHTINDNLEHIDPSTLKMVGTVVANVVYNE